MRAGLIQLSSSDDPVANIEITSRLVAQAAGEGANFILTPEVTNCVSSSRARQRDVLQSESDDITLEVLRKQAAWHGLWLLIGSLALKEDGEERFVNRSFLISPSGEISARYDKIHMFDVAISESETYRESNGYRPGNRLVLASMDEVKLGMTICYDVRFPYLFRDLAKAGAKILSVPSAFSPETGRDHWEVLLRARAIETGSFVLAPAQTGLHATIQGRQRQTYGHSLAVDPWGRVLADGGDKPGVVLVDLTLEDVDDVRRRLPSLNHDQDYSKT